MEQQQLPVVDRSVEEALQAAERVPVMVTFAARPSQVELRRYHLSPALETSGLFVFSGKLNKREVARLVARGDVQRIALVSPQATREKAMTDKIDPVLQIAFADRPGGVHGIVVVFTQMPDQRTLDEWSLTPVPPNEATGQLTRERIAALAQRSDVSRIRSRPRPRAF